MDAAALAVVAAALLAWSLASTRLKRSDVTGPMALVALGLLADATGIVDIAPDDAPLGLIAQGALGLLLFSDAARVDPGRLRHDVGPPVRLLAIGLPLTIGAGVLAARGLFPEGGWSVALLLAACLAPTDAGLGAVVVEDRSIPRRIRRLINVESGLNDGIVAPVVTLAIALVADTAGSAHDGAAPDALRQLGLGVVVGVVVGALGGTLLARSVAAGWSGRSTAPLAALSLAVLAQSLSTTVGGNGFIGAFVAGLAFARPLRHLRRPVEEGSSSGANALELTELGGQLLGAVVWFLFGAALLHPAIEDITWRTVVYAVLSLTVIRMVPVAIALLGAGFDRPTIAFVGWFGPRGMASLVFVIEAVDELGPGADPVLVTVGLTVVLSVIAHGASAGPLARRYSVWCEALPTKTPDVDHEIPSRSRLHRAVALGRRGDEPR